MLDPRHALRAVLPALAVAALARAETPPPILFVHGNGDSAALWQTTLWRFESNGYPAALLFAIDLPHPAARQRDSIAEENRSSTAEQRAGLATAVGDILRSTGRSRLVLVGSSRGGNTIREYVKEATGDAGVALAILCGAPAHGVFVSDDEPDSEWNGRGRYLRRLNTPPEAPAGVRFVTLRSDRNDKYAQPAGPFIRSANGSVGAGFAGPALAGADNLVLPGLDHREVAFHRFAFREMFREITGRTPERLDPQPEPGPVLDGTVSGYANGAPTNLPVAGATVEVYEVDPGSGLRKGAPRHVRRTATDGRWGPFRASATAYYELVVRAAGQATLHSYRPPFPRSARYVHLRLQPLAERDRERGALVTLSRPRGYLGHGRDRFTIDGKAPEGVNPGVPGTAAATMAFPALPSRAVRVVLNDEALTVRTFPVADGHLVVAEFHY